MCKVSVIIPNYNHSKYLPKRIESILNQVFQDFEVLILDDCSKDNSQDIILDYKEKDSRISIIFNDKNSGNTFIQWEKGINNTQGEYIWIAESDDYSDPNFLAKLVPLLDENLDVGVSYSQSYEVNESDLLIGSYTQWTKDLDERRWDFPYINNGKDELKYFFCKKNVIPNASAALIRRKALEKVGHVDTSMRLCGDKMFWTRLLLISDISFIPDHLNFFRTHTNNVRTKSSSRSNLIENFEWFCFLNKHVEIPSELRKQIFKRYYEWWVSLIVSRPIKFFSAKNMEILKSAYSSDKLALVRIFIFLFEYYRSRVEVRMGKKNIYA